MQILVVGLAGHVCPGRFRTDADRESNERRSVRFRLLRERLDPARVDVAQPPMRGAQGIDE